MVYNGVDTDEFARNIIGKKYMRKNLGVDQNITLFGMIGNIIPIKGHDFFLRGFVRAKSMNPNLHVKLLIVGRILDLTYYKKITKFIMENNLSENVIIKDYSPNIKEIFSAIDILSLPSQREGFSRSLIEGMSIGLPVVGTSLDEIKEAVTDKNKALLVEYNNEEKLAVSINKLAQNKKYRVDIGMENRNRAVESFKISDHAKAIENIYKELLN